jgi:FtsH-binding integral membrane protein
MPGCPYFIAKTFAHFFGALLITGISMENNIITDIEKKPLTHLTLTVISIFILIMVFNMENGALKYIIFTIFCICFGQSLTGFSKILHDENLFSDTIILLNSIFLSMAAIGFIDKGNMLGWGTYLYAGLIGLIISMFATYFMSKDKKRADSIYAWINRGFVLLFALYTAFDVEVLKKNAINCVSNPDYINESLHLYIDYANLYASIGNLLE